MSESGLFVTLGDRHPVTGSLFTVHLFHVETGVSSFSLLAGTFWLPRWIGVSSHRVAVCDRSFIRLCTAFRALFHQFSLVLLVVLACFLLFPPG